MIIVDFHSHVLPNMDDGSTSTSESIQMLKEMKGQGVDKVIFSSHFYPSSEPMDYFLERREKRFDELKNCINNNSIPEIYLGSEVAYFKGISKVENLKDLCIEGTNYILIEMPFMVWKSFVIEELYDIVEDYNIIPILAHIECFFEFGNKKAIKKLAKDGFIMQSNASFFLGKDSKTALSLLEEGVISVVGSDSHNLTTRKPNLGLAIEVIKNKNEKLLAKLFDNNQKIMNGAKKRI
ncbi:MAG: hypothetical protein IJR66_05185 [Clostridia bacterium]|nr:hypothetical protein [Clostridia bacterium]